MKAREENNQIKRYVEMPKCCAHFAGNFYKQSDEIHRKFGFYEVVNPEYDPILQRLGEIFFDNENDVFTYPVITKEFNIDELLQSRISEFDQFEKDFRREITELFLEEIVLGTLPDKVTQFIAQLQQRSSEVRAELQGFYDTGNIERLVTYTFYTEETEQLKTTLKSLKVS